MQRGHQESSDGAAGGPSPKDGVIDTDRANGGVVDHIEQAVVLLDVDDAAEQQ
jgi:hypothetical protein